jgi:hypothetical protein
MNLTVISYLKGIPAKNNNPEKPRVLTNFIKGVNATGDVGIVSDDTVIKKCNVAVLQGFVHEEGKSAPHLTFRKNILDYQKISNNRTLIIDSNLFLYRDPTNSRGYLRYSYDGIFPSRGEYCNDHPTPYRWEKIKKEIGFDLKSWRKNGSHILLCLQRNGGWSMQGKGIVNFFNEAVATIRKHTDRPILVRTHPGDKKSLTYSKDLIGKNITLSTSQSLLQDLNNAWATVVYNSSPSVASAIEGIPTFVFDVENSQSKDVANTDFSKIENPILFERDSWIQKLAQCHWNDNDLLSGEAWTHLRKWAVKN